MTRPLDPNAPNPGVPGPPCQHPNCGKSPERHVHRWAAATWYSPPERVTDHPYTNGRPS